MVEATHGHANARLLRPGETCWRTARAHRVAFLVDGEAYFGAVADALENAQHSVWLIGWDFHSAVRLRRGRAGDAPDELVPLLDALVRQRRSLHVRVLGWDFAMLYALEREFLPLFQFGARTHRRVHFAMDSSHPVTASQHQKLAVVDDAVAFVGGLDLTAHRWDTREHRPDDPRRVTPSGESYQPFHDVQMAVDGEAASALGALARDRWKRATGKKTSKTTARSDPWPRRLAVDVRDVEVGISRTQPSFEGSPEVREIEALYGRSIAAARRWIYIENQYLTSPRITEWLAARLGESAGPEVVIVGPRRNAGWLEESTMGSLRDRAVSRLRDTDPGRRLRVLYPHREGLPQDQILNVHSKVTVIDDDFVRVGSANLSNRSMGLDTECDLSLEALERDDVRRAIAAFRNGLVAEHLGATPDRVARQLEERGSLVETLDALGGGERTLRPLEIDAHAWTAEAVEALGTVDPEHPIPLEELVSRFSQERPAAPSPRGWGPWRFVVPLAIVAGFALAWRFTPLADWATPERLTQLLAFFRETWLGPALACGIFTLACLVLVPVTALIVASGLAFGPIVGVAVAWIGSLAASVLGLGLGRVLWRDSVRRLAGDRLQALSRRLGRRGILSTVLVRVVPVAPFMVVNLVAGASHVRLRDFVIGTALGMFPGTVLLIVAADRLAALVREPSGPAWLWAALAVLALVGTLAALRWFLSRTPARN